MARSPPSLDRALVGATASTGQTAELIRYRAPGASVKRNVGKAVGGRARTMPPGLGALAHLANDQTCRFDGAPEESVGASSPVWMRAAGDPRPLAYGFFAATMMISTFVLPSSCTPTQARVGGFRGSIQVFHTSFNSGRRPMSETKI